MPGYEQPCLHPAERLTQMLFKASLRSEDAGDGGVAQWLDLYLSWCPPPPRPQIKRGKRRRIGVGEGEEVERKNEWQEGSGA